MSEIDDIAGDFKKSVVNKIDEMKEKMEEKINEIEDERDTNYYRCQEVEEKMERKICEIEDERDTNYYRCQEVEQEKEEKERKLCKVEEENVLLKNTISKINPHFNEDVTFNGDCTENIDELTKLIKLQNKLIMPIIYDITVNSDKKKLSGLDFTWAEINGIYVHDWDDPDYTYTENNTFNGFLKFLDIKDYGVNNNRAIKLLCENSSIFECEKAFGMSITLKKDKDKECGMVYLTSWNMYSED